MLLVEYILNYSITLNEFLVTCLQEPGRYTLIEQSGYGYSNRAVTVFREAV